MIPDSPRERQSWQVALADLVTDPVELLGLLDLPAALLPPALSAARGFALRVPRGFVARMEKGNPRDPLLLQVLPLAAELTETPGFTLDPLAEKVAAPTSGILHKYHGRVLLMLTGACAINCRYCFRRHFPYQDHTPRKEDWEALLDYLRADSSITEVILSGGDPLVLSDRRLGELFTALDAIPHLQRLRIHSRLPVVLPERLDEGFRALLRASRLRKVLVMHANHARELDAGVAAAMAGLKEDGVTLLNQSVLLKGINDEVETLAALSERLFEIGVMPYYLHLLDRVQNAAHFELPEAESLALYQDLLNRLPGYLVPRLVREIPGKGAKTPLAPMDSNP